MSKRNNFWQKIKKPFFALAPMAGYTDQAFRLICKDFGADVLFSEMVSSEAIYHKKSLQVESRESASQRSLLKTLELIRFSNRERPFVVQIFGANPKHMVYAAQYIASGDWAKDYLKLSAQGGPALCGKIEAIPDGIDINMGCPAKDVVKEGAGAALIKNFQLATKIVCAVKKAVKIPVSVKTRLGWDNPEDIFKFAKVIEKAGADILTIHGRTYKQGFVGPADLEIINKVARQLKIPVIANGGIDSEFKIKNFPHKADPLYAEKLKISGYMLGRGALGNPWAFSKVYKSKVRESERKNIILKHAKLAYKLKGEQGIIELRKHLCFYIKDLKNAKKIREKLVRAETIKDIEKALRPYH